MSLPHNRLAEAILGGTWVAGEEGLPWPLGLAKFRNHFRYCSPFVEKCDLLRAQIFQATVSISFFYFLTTSHHFGCLTRKPHLRAKLDEIASLLTRTLLLDSWAEDK